MAVWEAYLEDGVGTITYGHDTAVVELNIENFTGNISAGLDYQVVGTGDSERLELEEDGWVEFSTWNLGVMICEILLGKYQSGSGSITLRYKNGNSESNCEADSWNLYSTPFACTGWVKVRIETPSLNDLLINTGLVVRYLFNEADSGTTPTEVLDQSDVGTAFNLTIDYDTDQANYTEINRNRGLEFINTSHDAIASKIINDTSDKVRDALHGSQVATLEIVARYDNGISNQSRVFGLCTYGGNGELLITIDDVNNGEIRVNDEAYYEFTWSKDVRNVWHVVVDSTLSAGDRVKIYKDGVAQSTTVDGDLTQDSTFSLPSSDYVVVGNREERDRDFDGVVFYAAIYDIAFTAPQCLANSQILIVRDN